MEKYFYTALVVGWIVQICRYLRRNLAVPSRSYEAEFRRVRLLVLRRDGYRCQECGSPGYVGNGLEVHHIRWRSRGGTNDPSNLVTLCRHHHRMLHR